MAGLALIFGLILSYAAFRFKVEGNPVVEKLDELLPQSQCGKCGYPGCRPYAEAIINANALINLCSPGGENTVHSIADLLNRDFVPLDQSTVVDNRKTWAVIDEQKCIGCTLCIQACPVDAIVGSAKQMHTVITAECTGCEKCLPPCPVACITMVKETPSLALWHWPLPCGAISQKAA